MFDFKLIFGQMITASDNEDSPRKRSRVFELDHGWTGWIWFDSTTTCTSEENSRQDFHATYEQLELLGEGGFESVFAGIRGEDHSPVAIKRIHRDRVTSQGGDEQTLPLQVAIMLKMAEGSEGKSAAIAPLDFYDLDRELILVLYNLTPARIYQSHWRFPAGRDGQLLAEAAGGGEPRSSSIHYILYSIYVYTFYFFLCKYMLFLSCTMLSHLQ